MLDDKDVEKFYEELHDMTEEEKKDLDPICQALYQYIKKHRREIAVALVIPNRISAIAALNAAMDYSEWSLRNE